MMSKFRKWYLREPKFAKLEACTFGANNYWPIFHHMGLESLTPRRVVHPCMADIFILVWSLWIEVAGFTSKPLPLCLLTILLNCKHLSFSNRFPHLLPSFPFSMFCLVVLSFSYQPLHIVAPSSSLLNKCPYTVPKHSIYLCQLIQCLYQSQIKWLIKGLFMYNKTIMSIVKLGWDWSNFRNEHSMCFLDMWLFAWASCVIGLGRAALGLFLVHWGVPGIFRSKCNLTDRCRLTKW